MLKYFNICAVVALFSGLCCAQTVSADAPSKAEANAPATNVAAQKSDKNGDKIPTSEEIDGISYCLPRYITDAQTRTIGEILFGEEFTFGQLTLRTDPKKRAGIYFFVMLKSGHDDVLAGTKFILSVDTTDYVHPRTFTFTAPEDFYALREIKLALTGNDCLKMSAKVNAWKLVIRAPDGKILARKQSWLWSILESKNKDFIDNVLK